MNTKLAKEVLEKMLSRVVTCKVCNGDGMSALDTPDACATCGGVGEVMEGSFIDIEGIRDVLEK